MDRSETTKLLIDAKQGDHEALNRLYRQVGHRLLALVKARMNQELLQWADPEDILQEVMIRATLHLSDFQKDQSRSFFAWMAVITGHVIQDTAAYHHQQKRDRRQNQALAPSTPLKAQHRSALSQMIRDEQLERLTRALAHLEEEHREAVIMRRLEERSFMEMAEILNRSPDACRMLYNRAISKLTQKMQHV